MLTYHICSPANVSCGSFSQSHHQCYEMPPARISCHGLLYRSKKPWRSVRCLSKIVLPIHFNAILGHRCAKFSLTLRFTLACHLVIYAFFFRHIEGGLTQPKLLGKGDDKMIQKEAPSVNTLPVHAATCLVQLVKIFCF